jgi:hypothetical protein
MKRIIILTAALFTAIACSSSATIPAPFASYELDCAAANTATAAQLQCVRTDTRSGDVAVIDYLRLPVSSGPTAAGNAPPGRFTTSCSAPSTDKRADFYCIRMNTETGELLLINLQKANVFPPR